MAIVNKIRVLKGIRPFLRIIKAFNAENFHTNNRRSMQRSVLYAFFATLIVMLLPIYTTLCIWYLIEQNDLNKCVAALPALASLIQMNVIFIVSMMKNHIIIETVHHIQKVVERREYFFPLFLNF